MSGVIRRFITAHKEGACDVFERLPIAEREKAERAFVPADAVGLAVMCKRYAAFARSLLDRVRYAELLKIADASVLRSVPLKAAREDRGAVNSLLEWAAGSRQVSISYEDIPRAVARVRAIQQSCEGPPLAASAGGLLLY